LVKCFLRQKDFFISFFKQAQTIFFNI